MARCYLNRKQEMWLYDNFSSKSNQELADILTDMVRKENEIQISRLEAILKNVTQKSVIKAIESELEWRKAFNGLSASYIKHAGMRLKCSKKSFEYVSSTNREKAKATNIKRWLKKAEKVEHVVEWLRSFKEKDIRFCIIEGDGHLKSMRVSINKFNRYEGYNRRIYLTSQFIPEVCLLRVNASLFRTTQ